MSLRRQIYRSLSQDTWQTAYDVANGLAGNEPAATKILDLVQPHLDTLLFEGYILMKQHDKQVLYKISTEDMDEQF